MERRQLVSPRRKCALVQLGCDFGCNATNAKTGGVSTNSPTLSAGFARMKDAGMHVARWWVFPGDAAQILRDGSAAPTDIDPAVYTDFDAALQLL
jgi:hypothetical protein